VVEKYIKKGIASAAGSIVVGLQRHKPFEQRIEYIQNGEYGFSHPVMDLTHKKANLRAFGFLKTYKLVKAG
jgi:hypothetical protein